MSFALRGDREMAQRLRRSFKQYPKAAGEALQSEAESILAASQVVVPVETGALKETGRVTQAEIAGGEIAVAVTYGDESVQYAAAAHETADGAAHKYLERPLRSALQGMKTRLADRIKSEVSA